MITFEDIQASEQIRTYITEADASLKALGYTEHSFAHVTHTALTAARILEALGHSARTVELAKIAGYLHDIGNLVNRVDHSQSGAVMAFSLLREMNMDPCEVARITTAIGNHDEGTGVPVSELAAALILADKSDVRRSRVRAADTATHDIHDRVNYSVTQSNLSVDGEKKTVTLTLTIDSTVGSLTDYFEIFLGRMLMCRKAAKFLGLHFQLVMNGKEMM